MVDITYVGCIGYSCNFHAAILAVSTNTFLYLKDNTLYKIKSSVGEIKALCGKYLKKRKETIKNKRVKFINEHINDKNFFGKRKYMSAREVIQHMKKTGDLFSTIWIDSSIGGSLWESKTLELLNNISNLSDEREIWLTEEMGFLFKY